MHVVLPELQQDLWMIWFDNGYSDWFMPSRDELSLMYAHRDVLQFFTGDIRFSSSQRDRNHAWGQDFSPSTNPGAMTPNPLSEEGW